ncbi:MAG: metallophosphoesterase [Anaerolineae bacterium]|nr:metallophosphoesterase [Anaerolineae bacterium]
MRPPKFITDVVYPNIELLIDLIFLSSLPIGIAALIGTLIAAWQGLWLWAGLGLVMLACAAIGIYARFIAPKQLHVRRLHIGTPENGTPPAYTIAYFSDLHVGRFKRAEWTQRVVDAINAHTPDLILYGGDFYGHPPAHLRLADLLGPLAQLKSRLGVFAVMGNHDHGLHDRTPRKAELHAVLPQVNIRILHNESFIAANEAGGLRITGLGELWVEEHDVAQAFAEAAEASAACHLVIAHNPDLMQEISHRADLFLFGHTHAGQIYLPFAPSLGVPVKYNLYRGSYHLPQGHVYITSGCGEASTPTRLNTWPEIVIIEVWR